MALTAIEANTGKRVTSLDYPDDRFDDMRGNPRRTEKFACQFCEWSMHPKRLEGYGTKFFAHDPGADCAMAAELGGESAGHLAIKAQLMNAINAVEDWTAAAEVRVNVPGGSFFVADVVAKHKRRTPWTFEVQLSRQSRSWAKERTSDRRSFGKVNWLITEDLTWRFDVPTLKIDEQATTIESGIFDYGDYQDELVPVAASPLAPGISAMLADRYRWVQNVGWLRPSDKKQKRRKALPNASQGEPVDECHRVPAASLVPEPQARPTSNRRVVSAGWSDADWMGRARMAEARRFVGIDLDATDVEALRRFPEPPSVIDGLPGGAR